MSLDVQTKVDGGVMNITCNAEGYTPEEISVTVEGDELVVKGTPFLLSF
jgi:HSP20 family molecular chaperone IbpA